MSRRGRAARLVVFISGHGFGHIARVSAVLSALVEERSVRITVVTAAPSAIWPRELVPHTERWIATACDAGVVQSDDLHVDVAATRIAVRRWSTDAGDARRRIVAVLDEGDAIDCIVGDLPPMAFEIGSALGVPAIALANFSWDWIYECMGLESAANSARAAYEKATLLLECTPSAPMRAFPRRTPVGVIGRRARRDVVPTRAALGIATAERCVLLALRSPLLERVTLPAPEPGLRYLGPTGWACARGDCVALPRHVDFLDALSIADVVVAKAGYGILGDCAINAIALLWVRRKGFPEDPVLASWLETRDWAREVDADRLASGAWRAALESLWQHPRVERRERDSSALAANEILRFVD